MIGETIDQYRIDSEIGPGNYGTLFWASATDGDDNQERVLLKLLDRTATDYEFRRLSNEIRLYAQIDSRHLSAVLSAGFADGVLYYVMRPYDGTLDDGRRFGRGRCLAAVAGAARGAHDLHEIGVAHRDIRPGTVAVDGRSGRLIDLGLAQLLPGGDASAFGPRGTVDFLAPEVARGEVASRASDVWSLGLTLHTVLSDAPLRPPPPEGNLFDRLRHVVAVAPAVDGDLPEPIGEVVSRCAEAEPPARFATASDFADAVDAASTNKEVQSWCSR